MPDWTCEVCGNSYGLTPTLLEREKKYHGEDLCGTKTTMQRVTINTVNAVQKEKIRGESFADANERLIMEGLECRKRHPEQ